MKKWKLLLATFAISSIMGITALAGEWKQDSRGWWYLNDDGSYPTNTWQIIDSNTYLFDENGYMRTGWIQTVNGNWYYLNPTGEIRRDDLLENGITYHFDSSGVCTNPDKDGLDFNRDYQSIIDQECLEAEKRLSEQPTQGQAYEEEIVYEHDVAPATLTDRYALSDAQF